MATPFRNCIPTSVYQYFDRAGVLIYVGITCTGIARNQQHNADKDWWQWVAKQTIEHYHSRAEALGREKALIQKYRPPFNIIHNQQSIDIRAAYVSARKDGRFDTAGVGVLPLEQRRVKVVVADADWDRRVATAVITVADTPAVNRLQHVSGVAVFEQRDNQRGKKIGQVTHAMVIGGLARVVMKIRPNITFNSVEVWMKPTTQAKRPQYALKQVTALDCVRTSE